MRTIEIRRDRSELRTLIVPGLRGSGPLHWQSLWQEEHPEYERVVQPDWFSSDLDPWAETIARKIDEHSGSVLLVAHSFGCLAAVRAAAWAPERIAGALLVAPADPQKFAAEAVLAQKKLGARWIVVASRNDPWMSFERVHGWATCWASRFVDAGHAGHINADAGYGEWPAGERLLAQLRREASVYSRPAIASLAA